MTTLHSQFFGNYQTDKVVECNDIHTRVYLIVLDPERFSERPCATRWVNTLCLTTLPKKDILAIWFTFAVSVSPVQWPISLFKLDRIFHTIRPDLLRCYVQRSIVRYESTSSCIFVEISIFFMDWLRRPPFIKIQNYLMRRISKLCRTRILLWRVGYRTRWSPPHL